MKAPRPTFSPSAGLGDLLGLLFTLLALLVAYKLAVPRPAAPVATLPPAACDLQRETCRVQLADNSSIELRIPGRPVVPNRTFIIEGSIAGGKIELLEVDVRGVDIDVSSPPAAFARSAGAHYRAEINLPFCTASRMVWQITVLLLNDGRTLKWPLQFHTETVGLHGRI